MGKQQVINVHVVSDATGATAESVLTSVVVQFEGARFNIRRFPFTHTLEQLDEILEQTPRRRCIIVFTMVKNELREHLIRRAEEKRLTAVDVMGPLIQIFARILDKAPMMQPGVFRHQDEDMYRVAEAIHFTLQHDDGQRIETVSDADLVILGVSRTGKTPTSIYLSCRKLKVANIPIIKDVPFPAAVARMRVRKVGFLMSLERQLQIRSQRARRLGRGEIPGYSGERAVMEDLEYCEQVYRRIPGLRTVDVTNRSIEETSEWITRSVL